MSTADLYGSTLARCNERSGDVAEHTNGVSSSAPAPAPSGVLVIEDASLLRKALCQGFREQGFRVWDAADGAKGVELYRRFWSEISVVLSDVCLPVLDGLAVLEALQAINPRVRVCFMTGSAREATRESLLRRGALRIFDKPLPSVAEVARELRELATIPLEPWRQPDAQAPEEHPGSVSAPASGGQGSARGHFLATAIARVASMLRKPR